MRTGIYHQHYEHTQWLNKDEKVLNDNINSNPIASDHKQVEYHVEERNELEIFENNFNSLRKYFNGFLADKM